MIELPKNKIAAELTDPQRLVILGSAKIGKTTTISTLENNLILDFEEGTKYIDAMKLRVNSLSELKEILKEIKKAGCPYDFITIDTITAVESKIMFERVKELYKDSIQFKQEIYDVMKSVPDVPNGYGWELSRIAMSDIINWVSKVTKNVIIVGHLKPTKAVEGNEGSLKEIDLTGKFPRLLLADSDAIAFCHRDDYGNLKLNFAANSEVISGARPKHLIGQDIIIAEKQDDGSYISYWERVFPSLKKD